jgi:ankyrin repeat domain-containing protein 50
VNKKADVKIEGGPFGNAFETACFIAKESLMLYLLQVPGFIPNLLSKIQGTCLQAVAYVGRKGAVESLIKLNPNVDVSGGF